MDGKISAEAWKKFFEKYKPEEWAGDEVGVEDLKILGMEFPMEPIVDVIVYIMGQGYIEVHWDMPCTPREGGLYRGKWMMFNPHSEKWLTPEDLDSHNYDRLWYPS